MVLPFLRLPNCCEWWLLDLWLDSLILFKLIQVDMLDFVCFGWGLMCKCFGADCEACVHGAGI